MNTANHISEEDLALFSLQFLPEDELKAAVEHMEHCEACRMTVGQMQGDLVAYAATAEMHTPPAAARERLLRRVGKEKKFVPQAPAHAEPVLVARNNSLFQPSEEVVVKHSMGFMGWAGWAIAAGVAVAGGLQFHQRQMLQNSLTVESAKLSQANTDSTKAKLAMDALTDTGAFEVALHQPVPAGTPPVAKKPEAHAAYDADKGSLVFVATNLDALPAYKTYELWILPVQGDPIPAGTFKPDANNSASVVMPTIPTGVTAKGFGVTVEDDGGAKSPTMPIVLAGF
jgi:anti-sigma-K factor RskA